MTPQLIAIDEAAQELGVPAASLRRAAEEHGHHMGADEWRKHMGRSRVLFDLGRDD